MLSLKLMTEEHLRSVVDFALKFKENSPYAHQPTEEVCVQALAQSFLDAPQTEAIAILAFEDDLPVGVIAGLARQSLWNFNKHAVELVWWVEPEYRKTRAGLSLKNAYEYWAKNVAGCSTAVLANLATKEGVVLDKLYRRSGYSPAETAYFKEI